jgi:PadR family transcriptional regulator AphA
MLKYALLGLLQYRPLTGYELKGIMDTSTSFFWYAELSQIYVTLKSMEKQGLVSSSLTPGEKGRDKRVYQISLSGLEDLQDWLREPVTELEPQKDTLALKLFFSGRLDKESLLFQLRLQRELNSRQLDAYAGEIRESIVATRAQNPQLERDAMMWDAIRDLGERYAQMLIQWLDELIEKIEKER